MEVKILQWNILYKEKIENIVKQIKKLNPDIICLQELGINCRNNPSVSNTAEFVKDKLKYNAFFEEAQRWETNEEMDAIENGIFTSFPLIKTSAHFVQNQAKENTDYSQVGRIYIEVELRINDKSLTVGTTHLSYVKKFEITEEKKKEVDKLLAVIKDKKERYIFTGDLNSTPDSYTISELSKYFVHCGPDYKKKTWTTKLFEYKGFKEDKLRWRLDYVFATKDIKVISSEIINSMYSDHLPILTTISI